MTRKQFLYFLITFYALFVVMLGAYTRLSDSGLGCPDWPGCYGQITVASTTTAIQKANALYPSIPLEQEKAWPEMVHRYFAGILGTLIIGISVFRLNRARKQYEELSIAPILLIFLVVFQALLGKWTVSWSLHPLAVMPHLIGGMLITTTLFWQLLDHSQRHATTPSQKKTQILAWLLFFIVLAQIGLGGWTSSQYAALSCPDFPFCKGSIWPTMSFSEGFSLSLPSFDTYEGGVLSTDARTAIHFTHRLGAILIIGLVLALTHSLFKEKSLDYSKHAIRIITLLFFQIAFGIANVLLQLPILVATSHNAIACLLLLTITTLLYDIHNARRPSTLSKNQ
jgi:cytochrome c oxidase assembly protein subunit 15